MRVKELLSRRTEHGKTRLRDDGKFETEIYMRPVHFRDSAGRLREFILDLLPDNAQPGFHRAVKSAPFKLNIGQTLKVPQRFETDKGVLLISTVNSNASLVKIEGNKAFYPNAWTNVDLIRTVFEEGVKTDIILKTPSARRVFDFAITVTNATPFLENGEIVYRDVAGNILFKHPKGWMQDANGEVSYGVNYELLTQPGQQILRISLDEEWLNQAAYPVTIDPTVTTIQPDAAVGIDSFVQSYSPDANYGTNSDLQIGKSSTAIIRSLIKFNISSIPASAVVSSANLSLYLNGYEDALAFNVDVHRITADWNEGSVTWNSQPAHDASVITSSPVGGTIGWYSWSLASPVQGWVNGTLTNYGVKLKQDTETSTRRRYFYSSDHTTASERPKLVVTYSVPPTATGLTPGTSDTNNPAKINTLTPALSWTFNDADSGSTQSAYQLIITRVSDSVVVKDTGEVASSISSYAVPGGTLELSKKYKWKVRVKDNDGVWSTAYSSEVFIYTNAAPNPPTNLSPNSTAVIDATVNNDFAWTFQDPDTGNAPEAQSAYQLQIYRASDNALIHNTNKVTSGAAFQTVLANTLVNGVNYQWKVKVWDNTNAEGAYSSLANFRTGKPPGCTITSPINGGTYAKGIVRVDWNYTDPESDVQAKYQAVLKKDGIILEDSREVAGTANSHTFATVVSNNAGYVVEVTAWDSTGQSGTGTTSFTTDFIAPPTPTINVTPDNGKITIGISNPDPTGGTPDTAYNDIYRSGPEGKIRIAKNIAKNGSYSDYTPASGTDYTYTAVAVSADQTTAESTGVVGSITLKGAWLHDPADTATLHQFKYDGSGRNSDWQPEAELVRYTGRVNPVVVFGEAEDERVTVSLQMDKNDTDYTKLMSLIKRKSLLCYRDGRGRKVFGVVLALPMNDEFYGNTTTITVEKTSHTEAV